jgi:hypothetical protein
VNPDNFFKYLYQAVDRLGAPLVLILFVGWFGAPIAENMADNFVKNIDNGFISVNRSLERLSDRLDTMLRQNSALQVRMNNLELRVRVLEAKKR